MDCNCLKTDTQTDYLIPLVDACTGVITTLCTRQLDLVSVSHNDGQFRVESLYPSSYRVDAGDCHSQSCTGIEGGSVRQHRGCLSTRSVKNFWSHHQQELSSCFTLYISVARWLYVMELGEH